MYKFFHKEWELIRNTSNPIIKKTRSVMDDKDRNIEIKGIMIQNQSPWVCNTLLSPIVHNYKF